MSFSERLKELRSTRGLTQVALADTSGVPLGTIRDLEQAKREPLLATAQKLAAALGVSMDAFALSLPPPGKPGRPRKARAVGGAVEGPSEHADAPAGKPGARKRAPSKEQTQTRKERGR